MGTDGHDKFNKTFALLCEHVKSCMNTVLLQDTAVGYCCRILLQDTAVGYLKLLLWGRLIIQRYNMLFWHL